MNDKQRIKRNFRNTKKWKALRSKKKDEQSGIDLITLKRLSKTSTLHHMNLDFDKYTDLSNEENFILVNRNTHDCIHFLYSYFEKDESIIERLKNILIKMKNINK